MKQRLFAKEENKIKIAGGFCLALCSIFVQQKWFQGNILMLAAMSFFAVCFVLLGLFRIRTNNRKIDIALHLVWGLLFVLFAICTSTPIYPSPDGLKTILLNYLCAFFAFLCVYLITARWKRSMVIAMTMVVLLITANTFVFQFRAVEISIMDFLSLKTALSVADQYQITVTKRITGLLVMYVLFAFASTALPRIPPFVSAWKRRAAAVVLMLVTAFAVHNGSADTTLRTWRDEGTVLNGYLLNFYIGIREMGMDAPEQYSVEYVEKIGSRYDAADGANSEAYPNIIVIMDEAFADFTCFENELASNQPVTPFIDAMSENVIKGYAMCSVFGGNTANSEFEFLTGHNMMFLPRNTVPYQQYIRQDLFSLVWQLREYGYACDSTHPYAADGWARNIVYPYLGFENSYFLEDYPEEKMVRCFVSDEEVFDEVMRAVEKESDPLFLFAITMQNHGDYNYVGPDYEKTITLNGQQQGYPAAEQYLSLLHETDRAVEKLVTALENSSEDTVVLFFGDHYPKVEHGLYEQLNGGPFGGLDEQQHQYKVPFFIWANYEMPSEFVECTSLSYLGRYLLACAGIPLPAYYQFLQEAEQVIPALNANGYYSKQADGFVPFAAAEGEEKEMLDALAAVQYNNLFDSKNRNEHLFGSFIAR